MTKKQSTPEEIEIMGHLIDPSDIKNPHIRRALRENKNSFLFSKKRKKDHTDHNLHEDTHTDRYGDHTESSSHTDKFVSKRENRHKDYTDSHTDKTYDDYNDSANRHEPWDGRQN